MLGVHLVGRSAGTKGPLTRGHRSMTKLAGRLRGIASLLRYLARTPFDAWASALRRRRTTAGSVVGGRLEAGGQGRYQWRQVARGSTAPVGPAALVSEVLSGGQEPLGS